MRRIESLNDLEALGRAMFAQDLMLKMEIILPPDVWDEIVRGHFGEGRTPGGEGGKMGWPWTQKPAGRVQYTTTAGVTFELYRGAY